MTLAYPESAHSELGQVIARDHFIAALGDCELELKVRDRDPVDLEAAFKAAIRVETHLKAYEAEDERERRRDNDANRSNRNRSGKDVRHVDENSLTENEAIAKLCIQLERAQKINDEREKELTRVKALTGVNNAMPVGASTAEMHHKFPARSERSLHYNQGPDPRQPYKCYGCGKEGHIRRNCPLNPWQPSKEVNVETKGVADNYRSVNRRRVFRNKIKRNTVDVECATYLPLKIRGMRALGLLDRGSEVCLVPTKYVKMAEVWPASKRLFAANGMLGEALIRAELGDVIVYIN